MKYYLTEVNTYEVVAGPFNSWEEARNSGKQFERFYAVSSDREIKQHKIGMMSGLLVELFDAIDDLEGRLAKLEERKDE